MANWQAIGQVLGEYYSPQNQRGLLESQAMKKAVRGDPLSPFEKAILKYDPEQIQMASEELKTRLQLAQEQVADAAARRADAEARRTAEAAQAKRKQEAAAELQSVTDLPGLKAWTQKYSDILGLDDAARQMMTIDARTAQQQEAAQQAKTAEETALRTKEAATALSKAATYDEYVAVMKNYPDVPTIARQAGVLAEQTKPKGEQYVQRGTVWNELATMLGRNPTREEYIEAIKERAKAEEEGRAAGKPTAAQKSAAPRVGAAPKDPVDIARFKAVYGRKPKDADELAVFNRKIAGKTPTGAPPQAGTGKPRMMRIEIR